LRLLALLVVLLLLATGAFTLGLVRALAGEIPALDPANQRGDIDTLIFDANTQSPRVPGSTSSHYAPTTQMTIVAAGEIDAHAASLSEGGRRIAVLAQRLPLKSHKYVTWINAGRRPEQYGHDLYANLRTLDKAGCQQILVQDVPEGEKWDAIRDRLMRAASSVKEGGDTGAMAVLP